MKTGTTPVWRLIWPVFGSANQLTAGLALMGISAYILKGLKKKPTFTIIPMFFMLATTIAALILLVRTNMKGTTLPLGIASLILIVLAVWLVVETFAALGKKREAPAKAVQEAKGSK